jgi:phage terminase small subunit
VYVAGLLDGSRAYAAVLSTAELTKLNLNTHFDRGALAAYCAAYALWAEAIVQIEKYGAMVKAPKWLSHAVAVHWYRKQAGRDHDALKVSSRASKRRY